LVPIDRPEMGYSTNPYGHLSGPDKEGTVTGLLHMIRQYQDPSCGYKYIYMGCGDHSNNAHYISKYFDPYDLATGRQYDDDIQYTQPSL
jgi:hypothetical protein